AAMVTLAAAPEDFENPRIATGIGDEETVIAAFGRPDLATINERRRVDDDRAPLRWLGCRTGNETSATRIARHVRVARGNTLRDDWLRRVSSRRRWRRCLGRLSDAAIFGWRGLC